MLEGLTVFHSAGTIALAAETSAASCPTGRRAKADHSLPHASLSK
jgi:hypothetical protein